MSTKNDGDIREINDHLETILITHHNGLKPKITHLKIYI